MSGSEALQLRTVSVTEYLEGEARATVKHEYVGGRVFAMAGGRFRHNLIATNVTAELHAQLRGTPCHAINSDNKVRIDTASHSLFYYPDASVVCGDDIRPGSFQDRPRLVVEVISERTRRTDEGEKLQAYTSLPSVTDYLLVEQSTAAAVLHHRVEGGFERQVILGMKGIVELPSIRARLSLAEIYAGVSFEPDSPEP